MSAPDIPLGTHADATAGASTVRGIVRFCGPTAFAPGRWVGMELAEPRGKNNGTVNGRQYFDCKMNYGIFVKFSQVRPVEGGGSGAQSARQSRPASVNLTRRPSGAAASRQSHSRPSETPEPVTSPTQSRARPSLAARQSVSSSRPVAPPVRLESPVLEPASPNLPSPVSANALPRPAEAITASSIPSPSLRRPSELPTAPSAPSSPAAPQPTHSEEQELRARIRVLEARRADDSQHIRELETRLAENEQWVQARPRLQAKLNQLQQEMAQTKRELQDQSSELQVAESKLTESSEQMESIMLDKEVAEERAEGAEAELEDLKEKYAIAQVELGVLREGGSAPGTASDGQASLAYVQLERQNERLKEALLRLRDISQETEQEHRRKMADLEKELAASDEMQSEFDNTLQRLANADVQIESLKQQLDDALGAEDMLVQLTERNLLLGEKIEEMRVVIEDLEALKELNDELEENHVETEKALQEDIDAKEGQIREATRKIGDLEEAILDYDQTIVQFRDLVTQLTTELETLRTEHESAQSASALAASQTATVMQLNIKLQSSAAKSQAKAIEMELQNLKTNQANELLTIIQPYLPQVYVESDSDSTNTYLLFKRMAAKADLLNFTLAERYSLPEALNGNVAESMIGICEMRGRVAHLSVLCKRFSSTLRRCDPQTFLSIGRVYADVNPLEKRLDLHIDLLKREDFKPLECVTDVSKMINQFEHLADLHLVGSDVDLGERELDLALSLDHDVDFFASTMAWTKTSLLDIFKEDDIDNEMGDEELDFELITPLQKILDQCRSVRNVAHKLVKRIEDLTNDSSALKSIFIPRLAHLTGANGLMELALKFGVQLAQQVRLYVIEVKERKDSLRLTRVLASVRSSAGEIKAGGGVGSWQTASELLSQLQREATDVLTLATESDSVTRVTGVAPWLIRVDEIKAIAAVNVDAERKLSQLNEEMQELVRGIKSRDQAIKESAVKVQLMERRMEASKKQADVMTDLEDQLAKARKQEKAYEEAMEQLQVDLDALEQENGRLKQSLNAPDRQVSGIAQNSDFELAVPVEGNLEASHLLEQIDSLRGTVRFLRTENGYLKGQEFLKEIQSLPPLGSATNYDSPQTPSLTADTLSETDEDLAIGHTTDRRSSKKGVKADIGDVERDGVTGARKASLEGLERDSKLLYRKLLEYSASPKLIDLSILEGERKPGWKPQRKTAAYEVWERKREGDRLKRQVQGLRLQTAKLASIG